MDRTAAQGELVVTQKQAIAPQGIVPVDACSTVQVLGSVTDPVAAIAGLDLGNGHLGGGLLPAGQQRNGLGGGQPQALDVDVGIGSPVAHCLKGGNGHAKLLALGGIASRHGSSEEQTSELQSRGLLVCRMM